MISFAMARIVGVHLHVLICMITHKILCWFPAPRNLGLVGGPVDYKSGRSLCPVGGKV